MQDKTTTQQIAATLADMKQAISELGRQALVVEGQLATEKARNQRLVVTLEQTARELDDSQRRMADVVAYGKAMRALEAKPGSLVLQGEVARLSIIVARSARAMAK